MLDMINVLFTIFLFIIVFLIMIFSFIGIIICIIKLFDYLSDLIKEHKK